MPVLVTRADLGLGPDLVAALGGDGADVRAYATGSGDTGALQASGAFVAVGDLDDEGHLDAAMTDVHTVIVLNDGWLADPRSVVDEARVVAAAAGSAGVRRLVLVSLVGADDAATSRILSAHGEAEAALAGSGSQTLVVRIDGILEHGMADVAAAVDGDPVVAPVASARLVDGLVSLDAARSGRAGGHALFTALGSARGLSSWRGAQVADLVGRRWLPPEPREDLQAALSQRPGPPRDGADLWQFVDRSGDETGA